MPSFSFSTVSTVKYLNRSEEVLHIESSPVEWIIVPDNRKLFYKGLADARPDSVFPVDKDGIRV